uniref:Uncharacterized protein n=1 Tax=Panagrolaimus superbus TaxID=310955 RepID=A0A914ZBY6_9BILA
MLENERDDLKIEFDQLQNERDDLKSERDDLKSERDQLQNERDDLKSERDDLKSERDGLKSERDAFKFERDDLKIEFDQLQNGRNKRELDELLQRHKSPIRDAVEPSNVVEPSNPSNVVEAEVVSSSNVVDSVTSSSERVSSQCTEEESDARTSSHVGTPVTNGEISVEEPLSIQDHNSSVPVFPMNPPLFGNHATEKTGAQSSDEDNADDDVELDPNDTADALVLRSLPRLNEYLQLGQHQISCPLL